MFKTAYYKIKDYLGSEASDGIREICQEDSVLEIAYTREYVTRLDCRRNREIKEDHERSSLSDLAFFQILQYLTGKRQVFDFPYRMTGTDFQKSVWQKLCEIPYGETRSYKEIAVALGKPSACRAVGMACNKNPIWIAVPCHRVIGAGGRLTGYAGGITMKQALLQLEKETISGR